MFYPARRADKRANNPPVSSVVKNKDSSHEVVVVNISRKGLRFRSGVQYKIGDKLNFGFSRGDEENEEVFLSMNIKGKILNEYAPKDDDTFEYGVKFSSLLNWYEMNLIHEFVYALSKQ